MYNLRGTGVFAFLIICLTITGCKTPVIISYGSSFGHCVGFCKKELVVSKNRVSYIQSKNGDKPESKNCVQPLNKDRYAKVLSTFDFKSFYLLDSVIGCPDCADGGAEWIEVQSGKNRKKIMFEYNNAPEQFKVSIEQFKKLAAKMEDCKSK